MKIVAFTGKKYSGKDTAAKLLIEKYGWVQINVADGLRRKVANQLMGVPWENITDPKLKETPLAQWPYDSARVVLQKTAIALRQVYPDIFVQSWKVQISEPELLRATSFFNHGVVVTDYRYPNEGETFAELGATRIKIFNPRVNDIIDTAETESHIDKLPVEHVLDNNSTIQGLHDNLESLLKEKGLI